MHTIEQNLYNYNYIVYFKNKIQTILSTQIYSHLFWKFYFIHNVVVSNTTRNGTKYLKHYQSVTNGNGKIKK